MLTIETVDAFVKQYLAMPEDGLFGVISKKNYFWDESGKMITKWPKGQAVMNTKVVSVTYEAAHCLYAGKLSDIGNNTWMGDFQTPGNPALFEMKEEEVLDIDYEWQFRSYESIYEASEG
jgi:CMP-N-acetylneuraminic acid synthetase